MPCMFSPTMSLINVKPCVSEPTAALAQNSPHTVESSCTSRVLNGLIHISEWKPGSDWIDKVVSLEVSSLLFHIWICFNFLVFSHYYIFCSCCSCHCIFFLSFPHFKKVFHNVLINTIEICVQSRQDKIVLICRCPLNSIWSRQKQDYHTHVPAILFKGGSTKRNTGPLF